MTMRFAEFAGQAIVHRRTERRWELRIGKRSLSLSHTRWEQGVAFRAATLPVCTAAGRRRPLGVALAGAVVLLAAVTVIALAAPFNRVSARGSYSVSLAIPPVVRPHADAQPQLIRRQRRPAKVASMLNSAVPVAAVSADATDPDAGEAVESSDLSTTRQRALEVAMTTGSLQQWNEAGGRYGYVIAGPIEVDGRRQCRQLSVLTRGGETDDQVDVQRSCIVGPR